MKPFKETLIGKFLLSKGLGHLLDGAGTFVPGVRLLDKIRDAILDDSANVSAEDKRHFLELYRLQLEELDEALADTAGARAREAEFVKATGRVDWFMTIFGSVILGCFVYTVWASSLGGIPADMREIFIESRAAVRDIVVAIAGYYWGSSAGSRIKEMRGRSLGK